MFGGKGVLVVKSLMGGGNANNINQMLPMLMMMSDEENEENGDTIGKMIAFNMISGNNVFGGMNPNNNQGNGGVNNMLQTMMMMRMLK
jgi:hypothetical protein